MINEIYIRYSTCLHSKSDAVKSKSAPKNFGKNSTIFVYYSLFQFKTVIFLLISTQFFMLFCFNSGQLFSWNLLSPGMNDFVGRELIYIPKGWLVVKSYFSYRLISEQHIDNYPSKSPILRELYRKRKFCL